MLNLDYKRSWTDLFKQGGDYGNNISWLNNSNYSINQINFGGQTDTRLDVSSIEKVFMSDPISYGIYNKIQDLIVLSDFEVYEVKRDGSISSTRPAREYKQLLIDTKLRDRIKFGYLPAYYGTGLGDALTYRIKVNGKLEIKTEPFVMNGMRRVQIYGDENNENMEIKEYGVLNSSGREIYRFKAQDVIHHKYSSPNASPYFSASPGLVASKWLNLKYNILSAVDANASGGFKGSFFMSLDTQKLQKMGFSANGLEEAKGKLKEELRQANGIQNAGRMVFTPFPVVMQNTQMSNSEQRSNEFVPLINNEIFYAYGVDPAILDKRNSKYDTADQARDDLYQSCQATFKTIEQDVERGDLKFIDLNFDNSRFIFRIPRQFSQEEIRIKEIKNKELQIFFGNLKTANETFSVQGLIALPTEDKLKSLEEQGIYIKTMGKEVIDIKPSAEPQLADTFTQVSHGENVNRNLDDLDEVYSKYHDIVNMSASELEAWSNNECSKEASLDRSPIQRNLILLRKSKSEWTANDISNANRTISFVSRMKGVEQGESVKSNSGKTCPSKRDISLKNWAYDPNKRQRDFWQETKDRLDKSFKAVLSS